MRLCKDCKHFNYGCCGVEYVHPIAGEVTTISCYGARTSGLYCGADARNFEQSIAWVTPTDDDARNRPTVEVMNRNSDWAKYKLVAVMDTGTTRFRVTNNGQNIHAYEQCRMDEKLREDWK